MASRRGGCLFITTGGGGPDPGGQVLVGGDAGHSGGLRAARAATSASAARDPQRPRHAPGERGLRFVVLVAAAPPHPSGVWSDAAWKLRPRPSLLHVGAAGERTEQ
eukprot:873643-Prorocentrum_minimum.AAC.1